MSRDGEWLMTKDRIVKYAARLFLALILSLALLISLPTTVHGASNPIDLNLGGEGATSWRIDNVKPGDSGTRTVTLHNASSKSGFLTVWISDIVNSEGINPKSETGDTSEPGELGNYLLFNISCSRLHTNISLPTAIDKLPPTAYGWPTYLRVTPLNVGDTLTLDWRWQLPIETGNDVQGDSLSFTINYLLEEFPPPLLAEEVSTTGVMGFTTVTSEDGLCTLTIPDGTVGLTKELEPLTVITMLIMDEPPPPPEDAHVIGLVYDFQPSGATFEPPITLEYSYDPSDIPEGIAEEDLVIAYYDEKAREWVNLECTVRPETNIITASVSHFTAFAILGVVVPKTAIVSHDVADNSSPDINGLSGSFTGEAKPTSPATLSTEEPPVNEQVHWLILGGTTGAAVATWLLSFFLVRRRTQLAKR